MDEILKNYGEASGKKPYVHKRAFLHLFGISQKRFHFTREYPKIAACLVFLILSSPLTVEESFST